MDKPRKSTSILLSLVLGAFIALAYAALTHRGYVEEPAPETFVGTMFFLSWGAATAGAFAIATARGSHQALATGVTFFAWMPMSFLAVIPVLIASCAGIGPHSCGIS
jgi:cytochrome bd-type quinol oxidase subunit 2